MSCSQRGAVGIFGLFAVLLCTALVLGLVGIFHTLIARQGLQDAADAAAFASALTLAQGMNLLAALNLVMAALVAVLVAIRLAQTFCLILGSILVGLGWLTGGTTAALGAEAFHAASELGQAFERAKDVVMPTLEALHQAQRATATLVPWVAAARAMSEAREHAPADGAFALPAKIRLPVEPDTFPVLCEHALAIATSLASAPASAIGAPPLVLGPLLSQAGELGKLTSEYLCGDGGDTAQVPPTYTRQERESRPRAAGLDACTREPQGPACLAATQVADRARPDPLTGECEAAGDRDAQNACEAQARAARGDCGPGSEGNPVEFVWQEHVAIITLRSNGFGWETVDRQLSAPALRTTAKPPCGPGGTVSDAFAFDSGPDAQRPPAPVCQAEPAATPPFAVAGTTTQLTARQATRLFGCTVLRERTYPLANENQDFGQESRGREPHRVEKGLKLGDDALQVRAVAFGQAATPARATTWLLRLGRLPHPPALAEFAQAVSGLAVAQAEFYFDHDGTVPRADWLWHTRWTARLRRFRLPSTGSSENTEAGASSPSAQPGADRERYGGLDEHRTTAGECSKSGAAECEQLGLRLEMLNGLVLH